MTRVHIKHLERFKDRHGKVRLYYRIGKGVRTPLRSPEGSPEFWEDYQDAANGIVHTKVKYQRAEAGTLRWLVESYYTSAAFKGLQDCTKAARRGILEHFCENHGTKRYAHLQSKHIRKIRDGMADRPEAANGLLKALRQVFKHALEYDFVDVNPGTQISNLKPNNKNGFHAWSIEEVEQFKAAHPIGTKPRVAMSLLLYTGQRRSDVVTMGRQHVRDGWMDVTQQKTGKKLSIPVLDELKAVLDAGPTGDLTYLVTQYDKPFTSNGFGNWFRRQCDAAGLPQCSAHGLRKAAASGLAEKGCSTHEIMSITGHDSLQEVQRYTKAAEQKQLAERVRFRIDGQK